MNDCEYIMYARRQVGLKQCDLAALAGVTAACVSQAERGLRKVSPRLRSAAEAALATRGTADNIRNPDEARLIHIYRELGGAGRQAVMATAAALHAAKSADAAAPEAVPVATGGRAVESAERDAP